jgi:PAS domain S-box-containing protein
MLQGRLLSLVRWSATTAGGRIYAAARDITQRKLTEEELRDRTDELDRFFSIVPDLLSIASADGYFLRLNPAWEETLGYSREELMRSQFTDFVHPEDVASTRKAMTVLASRKELINFTNRVRRKDGSYRWFEWSATATNQQGYAAARDITERKQAEESLQLALQVGQIGTFEVDLASGCGTCTPELKEIWGIPEDFDEAEFASFCWTHMHPEDVDRVREDFERILASHEAGETEFRIVRPDGSIRWLRWLGKAVQDDYGGSKWFLASTCITRRKRTDALAHALDAINAKIHATIDVEEVLRHAAFNGADALGCDAAVIALCRDEGMVLSHALGFPDSVLGKRVKDETHPRKALATRIPIVVNDALNDPDVNREQMRKWGIRAALIVPLATTNACIGALFFSHRRAGVAFNGDDLDFARKLTSSLSLALENARLWVDVRHELAERANAEAALQISTPSWRRADRPARRSAGTGWSAGQTDRGAPTFNNLLAVLAAWSTASVCPAISRRSGCGQRAGARCGAALTQRMLASPADLRSGRGSGGAGCGADASAAQFARAYHRD